MNEKLRSLLKEETTLQQKIMVEEHPERKVKLLDEQYVILLRIEKLLATVKPIFLP